MNKNLLIVAIVILIAVLGVGFYLSAERRDKIDAKISSFEECVEAGYSVMRSLPEQCATPDGRVFTNVSVNDDEINTYEDCVEAGYPVMESYPEQCRTADGKHFVRDISGEEDEADQRETETRDPGTGEPPFEDEAIACTMDAKMCPDGSYVGRVPPSCEFALCPEQ